MASSAIMHLMHFVCEHLIKFTADSVFMLGMHAVIHTAHCREGPAAEGPPHTQDNFDSLHTFTISTSSIVLRNETHFSLGQQLYGTFYPIFRKQFQP